MKPGDRVKILGTHKRKGGQTGTLLSKLHGERTFWNVHLDGTPSHPISYEWILQTKLELI